MKLSIECAMMPGKWHGGKSEDRILVVGSILAHGKYRTEVDDAEDGCIAIFDGVGGLEGGAYASSMAAWRVQKLPTGSGEAELREQFLQLSRELREYNCSATTATGILFNHERALLFHIGNTRLWSWDPERTFLCQMTDDQTTVNELGNFLTPEMKQVRAHEITGALGGPEETGNRLVIQEITESWKTGSGFCLTTDGIHDYADLYELEQLLQPNAAPSILFDCVRKNGSDDDASVIRIWRDSQ